MKPAPAPLFKKEKVDRNNCSKKAKKQKEKSYPYAVGFEVWGKLAHFRMPETTSSRLTYPIPPKPTVLGMIASIMGMRKFEYLERFRKDEALVSVIYTPEAFNVISMGIKLINAKNAKPIRNAIGYFSGDAVSSLVNHTFVKNPKYTIFFTVKDKAFLDELTERLENHRSVFHFYLGKAACFGNFRVLTSSGKRKKGFDVKKIKANEVIHMESAVPKSLVELVSPSLNHNHDIAIYRMPLELDGSRRPIKHEDFVLDKRKEEPLMGRVYKRDIYGVECRRGVYAVLY